MKQTISIFEYARMVTRIEEEILNLLFGEETDDPARPNPLRMRPSQARPQNGTSAPPAPRAEE